MPSFASVKRSSNRKDERKAAGGPEKTSVKVASSNYQQSSKEKSSLGNTTTAELIFNEKLPYGNQMTQDHNDWTPSFFTAFKVQN